jgi:hypothetical protein
MSPPRPISKSDEGKRVVDADGTVVGRVRRVRDGTAYVDLDPAVADAVVAKLGWRAADGRYPLRPEAVATVSNEAVNLR